MAYTVPAVSAVDFSGTDAPYTVPAVSAVDFVLEEGPQIAVPGPLGLPAPYAFNDYSALITGYPGRYIMRLNSDPEVEIPISSWQATLQTDRQIYLQCVVPAATDYTAALTAAQGVHNFTVYQEITLGAVTVYEPLASVPLETLSIATGAFRVTATVSGYDAAIANAPPRPAVTLQNIRSVSQTVGGNARARGDIDWQLRPGNEVTADGLTFTATYINLYATNGGEDYMDVGSR